MSPDEASLILDVQISERCSAAGVADVSVFI